MGERSIKRLRTQSEELNTADGDDFVPLMGPAEVAKWLGVSIAWVRDHATRKSPRIPTVRAGKLIRFRPVDIR